VDGGGLQGTAVDGGGLRGVVRDGGRGWVAVGHCEDCGGLLEVAQKRPAPVRNDAARHALMIAPLSFG